MPDRILLMPLDERPCNAWYPSYLAPIAGVELVMPPKEIMPHFRKPGDADLLAEWFLDNVPNVDAAVVSADLLGYGGLIPSRIGHETVDRVVSRLGVLREAKRRHSGLHLLGFNIITRTSDSNSPGEEPEYWNPWGRRIYRLSQLIDRTERFGQEEERRELEALRDEIPAEYVADYLGRRERNHAVNRAMIRMAAEHDLDFLFLSQDDASPFGLPACEQRVLRADIREFNVGDKVVVYPGADEVGSILLARAACHLAGYTPRFYPRWSSTGGEDIIALFEDRPLGQTVRGEIYCAGGVVVENAREADVILFVNTPGEAQDFPENISRCTTVDTPARNLPDFLSALRHYARYTQVAVADVAYCNGADPALIPLLPKFVNFPQLAGYAGWNTAANTIGTVVAHAALRTLGLHHVEEGDPLEREAAHQTFLFSRILEDWGYQTMVRTQIGPEVAESGAKNEDLGPESEHWRAEVERRLNDLGAQAFDQWFCGQGSSPDPTIRPANWRLQTVTLPWDRTFEVGIDLSVNVDGITGEEHIRYRRSRSRATEPIPEELAAAPSGRAFGS